MIRVCFVCLGNICRSPTAEGVFRALVDEAGLASHIETDSAGTAAYHSGERADERSRVTARAHGVELHSRARKFEAGDFARFDYVVAMDRENRIDLCERAPSAADRDRVALLRDFAGHDEADVPDPYYGGPGGFESVFRICEEGCRGLLAHIVAEHRLAG